MNLPSLKPALLGLLLWQSAPHPTDPASHFRYRRSLTLSQSPSSAAQACAVLDANVFAHAAASLKDVRLFSGSTEIPYATTLSEPLQQEAEDARILNLHSQGGHILFDLEMPHRPYTGLVLDLAAQDYIAKVVVSGTSKPGSTNSTKLGTFTLFDLTSEHLSHDITVPLSESTFPYLHLDLALTPSSSSKTTTPSLNLPTVVKAVSVPPSREAQSIYTTTQRATSLAQKGETTVAFFKVDTHVPVERIVFQLPASYKGNFSRTVKIEARRVPGDSSENLAAPSGVEDATGSILRVHKSEAGNNLSAESLSIPVSLGSNMQRPAQVNITVENGQDAPIPLSVELQMRQRRICFDTRSANAPLTLYYGDPSLDAPAYTDATLDQAAANPRTAQLEAEIQNPGFIPASTAPKSAIHRPVLRWIALLGCICIFALLVIRRTHHKRH